MSILFNIGLSVLSSNTTGSAEGRRILSFFAEGDIQHEENGRPFFPDRDIDFNISHSGNIAAVSCVLGKGLRTGCDVQRIQTRTNTHKIAEEFFSATERDYMGHNEKRFFALWVLKECYLKLRGLSVFDMASAPSFLPGHLPDGFYLYELCGSPGEQYMLAAAIEGDTQPKPAIQWFSVPTYELRQK